MTLYPDIQKRAQAEIDQVIGNDRFPTFEDRPHLPYVEAVVKEIFRWKPLAPTSTYQFFHCFTIKNSNDVLFRALRSSSSPHDGRYYLRGLLHPEGYKCICQHLVRLLTR